MSHHDPDSHEFFVLVVTATLITALGLAVWARGSFGIERPGLSLLVPQNHKQARP